MASGSESDNQWEPISTTTASVAPPRLPLPPGSHSSHCGASDAQPWTSPSSHRSLPPLSEVASREADVQDPRTAGTRHLRLPPLDTSHASHRPLSSDQLPSDAFERHPSKRRRVEEHRGPRSPNVVSRSDLTADSSRLRKHADVRQHPGMQVQSTGSQLETLDHAVVATQKSIAWDSHAARPSRDAVCCSPGCQGPVCARLRSIVQDLVTEICTRDPHVSGATSLSEFLPPKPILPEAAEIDTGDALEWALQRLRWNNASLRNLLNSNATQTANSPSPLFRRTPPFSTPLERMKRQHEAVDKDSDPASQHQSRQFYLPTEQLAQSSVPPQELWRQFEGMDPPGQPPSRHYRSASFSNAPPIPSPVQSAQAARTLPSPSSLNLPIPPNLPSISSPSPAASSNAHLAHLQDLQHQVSVKQLALSTLQREYDSLLQKLERQQIKSQTLEKKFEVTDAEINNLTDDKERLAGQVLALETQVEELQVARDEARKMSADSATQYMKIVEMAGRLQGKSVEDKKLWDQERTTLLKRIAELEKAPLQSVQTSHTASGGQSPIHELYSMPPPSQGSRPVSDAPAALFASSNEETTTLRQEILELKGRIQALEIALKEALDESKAVRDAALKLATVGQRLETSAASALGQSSRDEEQQ